MKPRSAPWTTCLLALLGGALFLSGSIPGVGAADKKDRGRREHDAIRRALERGEVLPLTKILAIAAQRVPGDVIEVELENEDDYQGALIYEIKILSDSGRVREVKIDARTGAVLEIEDE